MHKIYTTYLSNMKKIPEGCMTLIVMRFPPFISNNEDVKHVPELSPKINLLKQFKKDNDFDSFKINLIKQFNEDKKVQEIFTLIEDALQYNDICFVCCEKDYLQCHRSVLGNIFKDKKYEWSEL